MVEDGRRSVDLWEDELILPDNSSKLKDLPSLEGYSMSLGIHDEVIYFQSREALPEESDFHQLLGLKTELIKGVYQHETRFGPLNAFVLRHALTGVKVHLTAEDGAALAEAANKVPRPKVGMSADEKTLRVSIPSLKLYKNLLQRVNAYPLKDGNYSVQLLRAFDLEAYAATLHTKLPKLSFSEKVRRLNSDPIPGFDGSLESLKNISVAELNVVSSNTQSYKALKSSAGTLAEKLEKYGVTTLHDLLFRLPRRYIDKSKPQEVRDLIEGESSTIVGTIKGSELINSSVGGVSFIIEDATGSTIRTTFWRQHWLRAKFKEGASVIVTGRFSWWMKKPQLNGDSIDFADDVAALPIVPIYRQAESKGLTTYLFMAANRELLARLGTIKLPLYLQQEGRLDYQQALTELHFPTSLEAHREALDTFAYYELVYMQVLMQHDRENLEVKPGVRLEASEEKLQTRALKALPFELTKDQKKAIVELNDKLSRSTPSSTLLLADVGAGKTIVAQMACLRAVEAGHQAVLVGPTDVLARQLYSTFQTLTQQLEAAGGRKVRVELLARGLKAKEKKELLKAIAAGEVDIVVGTHAVFSDSVTYANLGFLAIDEQQKFGAEQRTKLLNSRSDGHTPHLLLQTATPIPRSIAQALYGDMELIEIQEKPKGRLPITTEWLQEDPQELITQALHPLWSDIAREAAKGHQTFIITPMVIDSDKVDAASVERTYKLLAEEVFSTLKVGFSHGKLKPEEQKEAMEKFRAKEFDVLVASTVVEVGVDIPDATRVVVLSAGRLGASTLHQIRGRAGRNDKPSSCYLVDLNRNENTERRLQALVDSDNGFTIATIDLSIRGEGKMFASEQSGRSDMIFASLAKHKELIGTASQEASRILRSPLRGLALKDARERFASDERLY